jgi:prepilin-type N-terminal cleavage/methylation domain-containing protein
MRGRESGFTLIEMVIALAVVGILATIALPSFFGESRKTRAFSEVQPMFNDLRVRIEQYMQENGTYPPSLDEATMWPSGAPSTPRPVNPLPTTWQNLKVRVSGADKVVCGYTWLTNNTAGWGLAPNNSGSVGTQGGVFRFTAPPSGWYYLLAQCDMDGDGVNYSWYFTSSIDNTIQKLNEGN